MRLPVDWINEYVPNSLALRGLADVLTDVGLEVEAIEDIAGAPVLDIKVPSNRGDCLSVLGIARELGSALREHVTTSAPTIAETGAAADTLASVVLDDPDLCPRYSARIVRNVKIGPSPSWARRRLELCGLRPINNVVDATNLVMLELGQPLHAFDYRLLRAPEGCATPTIIVRLARAGERLVTIDGEDRALIPGVLLITDPSGPIALAGIMGGASTEIHDGTTEVLLESAHFDASTIRRGARALQMSTEASYRFERVVDPGGTVRALDRACQLIAEFHESPVEIAEGVVDAYPHPVEEVEIELRPARANALLGLALSAEEIAENLRRLDLEVHGAEALRVRVPTFRQDLKEEIDLIEEVARAHAYAEIPETLPTSSKGIGRLPADLSFEREARAALRGLGLSESVSPNLESPEALSRLQIPDDHPLRRVVAIDNAKTIDRSRLRTTLLSSLLEVIADNRRHGVTDVSIFDLGRVYWDRGGEELPDQPQHVGLAGVGIRWRGRWAMSRDSETWDFYGMKGAVEGVLEALSCPAAEYAPDSHPCLEPGRTASVSIGSTIVGHLGEASAGVRDAYGIPDAVYVAELDLDALRLCATVTPQYQTLSRFPAVSRDVALLLPRDVPARRAEAVIREAAGSDLESLSLFDAYEGKPLPEGQRNLAFSLSFRKADGTFTEEEIEAIMVSIRARLREELGGAIRE